MNFVQIHSKQGENDDESHKPLPVRGGRGALLFARPAGEEVELSAAVSLSGPPGQEVETPKKDGMLQSHSAD